MPLKHPLPYLIGVSALAALGIQMFLAPPSAPPATGADLASTASTPAEDDGGSTPVFDARPRRALDDYRYGLHLRYPLEWEERSAEDLPSGLPGVPVFAAGPPGQDASVTLFYVGVLVPRPGIEALARRWAEMAATEVHSAEWVVQARRRAFRILARGERGLEETTFFTNRHLLFACRIIAGSGGEATLRALREVTGDLRLD